MRTNLINKKQFFFITALLLLLLLLIGVLLYKPPPPPIRIGVLHSLTGTMAVSEKSLVDMIQFAVAEINKKGGWQRRKILPIVADCRSDWDWCAEEAERLISEEQVEALFGCWTSSCRKAVKPVVEAHEHLLFYPVQYEGLESSSNIIYTGAAPNQQIIPAVRWALDNNYQHFYLIGSDYIFPRTANLIIKDLLRASGSKVLGESYLPLGSTDTEAIVAEIAQLQPDMILNTINGDSNQAFFQSLYAAGITADFIPVMSFSIAEPELVTLPANYVQGHYAAWNYFQSIKNPVNQSFTRSFQMQYGADRVIGDSMEASYISVYLWWQAVLAANTTELKAVYKNVLRQSMRAPQGVVSVKSFNGHLWKWVRIGQIRPDKQFNIVWESPHPVAPEPFPTYRSQEEWKAIIQENS